MLDGEGWIEFADVGDQLDMIPGGERTFSLWLRYDRPQYHAKILDKTRSETRESNGYAAFVHQYSTSLGFWHRSERPIDETGYNVAGVAGTRRIGDGEWHHVAIVQRDTILEGWADGRLEFATSIVHTVDRLANDLPLTLGWDTRDVIRFSGSMDEFSVWERALDQRELRRLMYRSPAPDAPGLIGWWPMDGTAPDRLEDAGPLEIDGSAFFVSRERSTRPLAPPLFERPLVHLGLGLAGLILFYGILRLYGRRLERQKRRLELQVQDRVRDLDLASKEKDLALETVAAQAERLAALGETRSRFFTNISHEFRTPLSLILGPLSDLLGQQDASSGEDRDDAIRVALRNGRRLQHLTEQLLDLARLESGALTLDPHPIDLGMLLKEMAQSFQMGVAPREVRVEADFPEETVPILGDAQRLETVFGNLLSNAVRFTPNGGLVRLVLTEDRGRAIVTVEDQGPGIPTHQAERVFERFFQTGAGIAAGDGTGVGLALVRELTELHGGSVRLVRSGGPGALFRVELPIPEQIDLAGIVAPTSTRVSTPTVVDQVAGAPPTVMATRAKARPLRRAVETDADRAQQPVVLLVEDHSELRAFTRSYLERSFRVVEAADGHEGIAMARELLPDVVVTDVMMPWMDGIEMLTVIRADEELADVPVIMLTAKGELGDRIEGLERGADAYMAKPFEPAELTARIRGILARRMQLRERLMARLGTHGLGVLPGAEAECPSDPGRPDAGGGPRTPVEAPSEAESFRARLEELVQKHLSDPNYGVSELAAGVAMERTGLYRHMAELLNVSPSDFLRERRMARAAELLNEANTVAEVAYAVGYGSVSSFSRRFREHFGVTPGQWSLEHDDGRP